MPLSSRTAMSDATSALAAAAARARDDASRGGALFDLTVSNPTTAQIPYDSARILAALADPRALRYAPEPLGLPEAREAVARDLRARGVNIDATSIAITASTSEAYAILFKILCDPGDEVLVPRPSYPLLEHLATFESVTLRSYPLVYAGGWHVDVDAMRAAVTPRTRAIVVVSPNNPTGSYLGEEELEVMLDLGLPIVSDEVFASYPLADGAGAPPAGRVTSVVGRGDASARGLTFALSGLSKLAALPQLKLGWIAVDGAPDQVAAARARLELVLDAYLSVGAPVQHALPALLASRRVAEGAILARARENLAVVRRALRDVDLATVLDVEGGWYVTIRVPETQTDEQWALALCAEDAVLVQPGYLFDMDRGAHLVVSLLTPEPVLAEGIARIAARLRVAS